jgi:ankyrin repeat protein
LFLLISDQESAQWIACNIGNEEMLYTILKLKGELRDDLSRDGTTVLSIALAKGNETIVELLLKSKVAPKSEMEALHKAYTTKDTNKSAPDHE